MNQQQSVPAAFAADETTLFRSIRNGIVLFATALCIALLALSAPASAQDAATPDDLPKVYVLATGGTIAGSTEGMQPIEALLSAVPGMEEHAVLVHEQVANTGSSNITVDILLHLANRINEIFATDPDAAGVVVTHGTDTIEETAYFLNLTVHSDKPVVIVGAMRNSSALSTDGPQNLYMGVLTAASPESVGRGVLLVLNDEIHAAREVTKTNTYSLDTFESDFGPIGTVRDTRGPYFYLTSTRRHTFDSEFDVTGLETLPRVDIVYTYLDSDATHINASIEAGAEGIVVATVGAGNMPGAMDDVLETMYEQHGVFLVRSSRTGGGRINPSNENNLARGYIGGDDLNVQKARILLMLALTVTDDPAEIQRIFDEY